MIDSLRRSLALASLLLVVTVSGAMAQGVQGQARPKAQGADTATRIEIYGFAQGDAIYDFKVNNPDWFDVVRPTKLEAFDDEFGANHHTWFSARQTRMRSVESRVGRLSTRVSNMLLYVSQNSAAESACSIDRPRPAF